MSSKAVDVRAKPTLREQYFTDRSGIAPAAFLSLSPSWSAALVTCQVVSTWKDLLASLWNEERAYSFDERGEGRRWNRFRARNFGASLHHSEIKFNSPIWDDVKGALNRASPSIHSLTILVQKEVIRLRACSRTLLHRALLLLLLSSPSNGTFLGAPATFACSDLAAAFLPSVPSSRLRVGVGR